MSLRRIRDLRLRDQVLLSYLALLIMPVLLTGISVFTWSARVVEHQTLTILRQNLRQAELNLTYAVQEVSSLAEVVYRNSEVQGILGDSESTDFRQYQEFLTLDETIRRIEDTPRVFRARLYVSDEKLYAREGASVLPMSAVAGFDDAPGWLHDRTRLRDGREQHRTLTYVLPIRDILDPSRLLGVLHIAILELDLEEILSRTLIEETEGHGLVLTASGAVADPLTAGREDYEDLVTFVRALVKDRELRPEEPEPIVYAGRPYRLLAGRIGDTDWVLANLVPGHVLYRHRRAAGWMTAGAVVVFCMLAAAAAVLVSTRITAGVHDLIARMESVGEVHWAGAHSSETDYSRDEIGRLRQSFQRMVLRLQELIDENYVANLQRREAELHALQAQINPHFLYNVLESINWMARAAKAPRISEMVTRVGRFYRLGLSGGRDTVTVGEELEYVRTYVEIQQIRFGESVWVSYDVDDSILSAPIAKLSLQPLVENALIHGILTKPQQSGTIEIHGHTDAAGAVILEVRDDGFEVDFDKVRYILSDQSERSSQGFGIRNVKERLRLFFGPAASLHVRREAHWTIAEIRLPALPRGPG